MHQQEDIKHLNQALKGEHMAIIGYDHYIQHLQDPNIKSKFQDIQQKHHDHARLLAKTIQDANGNPVNTAGLMGWIQDNKYRFLPKSQNANDIIGNALEGEELGVKMLIELSEQISSEYKSVMQTIIDENYLIIKNLNEMKKQNNNS